MVIENSSSVRGMLCIEEVCDHFETERRRGIKRPLIQYVNEASAQSSSTIEQLKRSLLLAEWDFRFEQMDEPRIEEYLDPAFMSNEFTQQLFADWKGSRKDAWTFGEFRLVRGLGQGRFGEVWEALNQTTKQTVALKIAHPGLGDGDDRFLREAEAAADLVHPGIARVYSAGQWQGRPYIVREFIEGSTLSAHRRKDSLTATASARLCLEMAQALSYSHQLGCVHRDLKPGNILVRPNGKICIIDFGLAKITTALNGSTKSGAVFGTPVYMSPEQALGNSNLADGRSDIYSIGVILFELLTNRLPFEGNFEKVLLSAVHQPPPNPRRFDSSIPSSLATIVLTCLQKDPDRRYQSAEELADDLKRFLAGSPIQASREGVGKRILRFSKSNPLITFLVLCVMLMSVVIACGAVYSKQKMRTMLTKEVELRKQAEEAENSAERSRQDAVVEALLASEVTSFIKDIFSLSDPIMTRLYGTPRFGDPEMTAEQILDRGVNRLKSISPSEPRLHFRLLTTLASIKCNLGSFHESQALFDQAEHLRVKANASQPNSIEFRDDLLYFFNRGKLHQFVGEFPEAQLCYECCLNLMEEWTPEDRLGMAEVQFQTGWLYNDWKKPQLAEAYLSQCIETRRAILGPDHQLVWTARLARSLCYEDTRELLEVGVAAITLINDPQILLMAWNAVQTRSAKSKGDYETAAKYQRRLIAGLGAKMPKTNPWYLLAVGDYAGTLMCKGDYKTAFAEIRPAIEAGKKLAPQHPQLFSAYRTLGYEMMLAERFPESHQYYQMAVSDKSRKPDDMVETRLWWAESLVRGGEFTQALQVLRKTDQRAFSLDRQIWAHWLKARIGQGLNDDQQFKVELEQAVELADRRNNRKGPPSALDRVAKVYAQCNQLEKAEELLRLAVRVEKRVRTQGHPRIAQRMQSLGEILLEAGKHEEAIQLLAKVEQTWLATLPGDDKRIAKTKRLMN